MATKKTGTTDRLEHEAHGDDARADDGRRTTRTSRRPTSGALTPRRRASRPGLPTTVGTALGTLVVTTLLDLSWPVRLGLIALVVVLGLAYVVHRNRAAIVAGAADAEAAEATAPTTATDTGITTVTDTTTATGTTDAVDGVPPDSPREG